jgi:predicted DsbA family dithiol-disulfide isomerase
MTVSADAAKPLVEVTEFADPGCPWSWASEPRIRWVHRRYRDHVAWRRVFGVQLDGPTRLPKRSVSGGLGWPLTHRRP